jgi:hypothetical protein
VIKKVCGRTPLRWRHGVWHAGTVDIAVESLSSLAFTLPLAFNAIDKTDPDGRNQKIQLDQITGVSVVVDL